MTAHRQHRRPPSGSNRPGLGSRAAVEGDHAVDTPDGEVVFSFHARARIREASTEAHARVVDRLRFATRQGGAASPGGLAAEVASLHRALQAARYRHGPAQSTATGAVRDCYLNIAASAIILAERATRPPELRRGEKSSTTKWAQPDFTVPER